MRLIFLLALPTTALAGPWTRDAGQAYVKVSEGAFFADAFRDAEGRLQRGVDYLGLTTALYLELGLLEGLHLQLYLPHIVAINDFETVKSRYLSAGGGDAQLGLQAGLPLPIPAAVRGVLKVPLYDVGAIGGREADYFPQRGDGQIDVSLMISAGYSHHAFYGFAEVGHQIRTSRFTGTGSTVRYGDGLVWAAQVGWGGLGPTLALNAGGVVPWADDLVTKAYTSVGPSVYWPVHGGLALELGYDRVVQATNSALGQGITLGLSHDLQ